MLSSGSGRTSPNRPSVDGEHEGEDDEDAGRLVAGEPPAGRFPATYAPAATASRKPVTPGEVPYDSA